MSVIERAKLCLLFVTLGCVAAPGSRRAVPSYDTFTGRLVRLTADHNRDGRADQWTYMDGNQPLRGEADQDGDGRIDRWEYFDARSTLVLIGTSSRGDGVEDTWTWPAPTPDGEMHRAISRRRDRHRDRHEYLRDNTLVRAEEDTNGDGRIDKWERYEGSVLREAAFDTTFTTGRADRRVRYDGGGSTVEEDRDGDGKFVQVQK
ncbi:MAG TPA: hypothetical protein VJ691_07135 [Vicinamibacterales bacterium]|nr:hypothetical protein [Vicinamibacterales bacterium]